MESLALSTTELLGKGRRYVLATPKTKRSRSGAWEYLLKHPPILQVGGCFYVPYRRHSYYALKKCHNDTHWRWSVFQWEPLEVSPYAEHLSHQLFRNLMGQLSEWLCESSEERSRQGLPG